MNFKRRLRRYLKEISNDVKFTNFEYKSEENFTVSLKCKIEENGAEYYNNYTKEWIKKFSDFTKTAWIVRNCFPNLKRLVYRKSFWCHRSSHNKSKSSERSRNLYCQAKIDFRVKFINKNTIRSDPALKEGLNMNIYIDFNHSHLVRAPESFNLLKSSSESDSVFCKYFNDGYSPSMAKCYHELLLTERYGSDREYIDNASMNPNLRHIIYLFQKKDEYKNLDENFVIQRKINVLQKNHTIKYSNNPKFIVVITPLMGRVVTQLCVESALIDVTSIPGGLFVLIIYVPTQVGSLPIACAIYTEQSVDIYGQIITAIWVALEQSAKSFDVKLVSLNNSMVKDVLTSIFPNIVIKLDRYKICREFWEWLCDNDNNIDKTKRHDIMTLFKSLVYADSMETASIIYSNLLSNDIIKPCLHRMEQVWQVRDQWIAHGDFCRNHVQTLIIFVKEFLVQKCKTFSFCAIMDVFTNILESHLKKIIIASVENEVLLVDLHTKFLPRANNALSSLNTQKIGQNDFITPYVSRNRTGRGCRFNADTLCCDCKDGVKGRICAHLTDVLNSIDTKCEQMAVPMISENDKGILLKIAGDQIKCEFDNLDDVNDQITERPMSVSSPASDSYEIKIEHIDPLKENHDGDIEDTQLDLKGQYETAMKTVNAEFRRLNKLFKDNPNRTNMVTMTRLAKELAKIRPIEQADLSNMFVELNT